MNLASYIEHSCLLPDTSSSHIKRICKEALESGLHGVCMPPYYVGLAKRILGQSRVVIGTVVGFPFGYEHIASKETSIRTSVRSGARSLNIALNISAIKSGKWNFIADEVHRLTAITRLMNVEQKFIFELNMLDITEVELLCTIMNKEGVDFVQLSTILSDQNVDVEQIFGIRRLLDREVGIKVSGDLADHIMALKLIKAGADRLGTSNGLLVCRHTE